MQAKTGATRADTRGTFAAPSEELYLLSLLNADRRAHHRRALTLSPTLSTVASDHSRDMAMHAYFGHQNLAGQGPFQRLAAAAHTIYRPGQRTSGWFRPATYGWH